MDEKELARRCKVLPEQYAGRVSDDVLAILRLHAEGGEWDELVSNTLAALAQHKANVTAAERDELRELAEATGEGREWLDQLAVQS